MSGTTNSKPRVGLLLLAAEWFGQHADRGRYKDIAPTVDADARRIQQFLGRSMDVVCTGVVHTEAQAVEAARKFRDSEIDLLIVCAVIWSEDAPLIRALGELPNTPLLVWCYSPTPTLPPQVSMSELFRRSGPVGMAQYSGLLKRMGKRAGFVCGSPESPALLQEIEEHASAAHEARQLKRATIGLVPYRCEVMTGTHVDEGRLLRELGPTIRCISIQEYADVIERIPQSRVEEFLRDLRSRYPIAGVGEESLRVTARASLGLAKLAEEQNLDAIALNDLAPELHRLIKVRPFLCVPEFFEQGRVMSLEADVAAAAGLLIVRRMSSSPPMYVEIFAVDEERNALLAGHAGMHDLRIAEPSAVRITPDYEYCESDELEGAWTEFRGKPGPVTMASFFCDTDCFKIVVAQGESLADGPRLEGFPNMLIRSAVPVREFFEHVSRTGLTQHWVVVHEDVRCRLRKLADVLGLRFETI
jgi:L-arabinose isomerase